MAGHPYQEIKIIKKRKNMKKLSLFYCIVLAPLFNISLLFPYNEGIRKDRINIKGKNKSLQQQLNNNEKELAHLNTVNNMQQQSLATCENNLNILLTSLNAP